MDAALRSLRRTADRAVDGATWLELARAALRARDFDEAGRAALAAEAFGDTSELLDALTPSARELRPRTLPFEVERGLTWAPDGRAFVGVAPHDGSHAIVTVDLATGARRELLRSEPGRSLAGSRVSVHPDGRSLAFTYDKGGTHALATLDLTTGTVGPELATRVHGWRDLVLTGASRLVVAADASVQIYALGPSGALARPRPWFVPRLSKAREGGWSVALEAGGGVLRRLGTEVELFDPGSTARRLRHHVVPTGHALRARRRLILVEHGDARLLAQDGTGLGQSGRPRDFFGVPSPSPSGRFLAYCVRPMGTVRAALSLVDLREPLEVRHDLGDDADPSSALWSPSGRKLLVRIEGKPSLLFEAR